MSPVSSVVESLVSRDRLGFEAVERPAILHQDTLDHRVALKRGHRVAEKLSGATCWIRGGIEPELVRRIVAGEPQLADDRCAVTPERRLQNSHITRVDGYRRRADRTHFSG